MVRPAGLAAALPAQDRHALDERLRPDLIEQPRLSHAALAADEPRAPLPLGRVAHNRGEPSQLLAAAHERRCPQEALSRGDGLARDLLAERGRQGREHVGGAAVALARQLRQEARQRGSQALVQLVGGAGQRRVQDVPIQGDRVLLGKRVGAHEQLVRDQPEGIEVSAVRDGLTAQHLRGHVGHRAGALAVACLDRVAIDRQAKVQDLHLIGDHDDVLRLEVAMDDPVAVQVGERPERLHEQIDLHGERLALPRLDDRQRILLQVHGEERHTILVEAVVEHAHDVGVPERSKEAELLREHEPRRTEGRDLAAPGVPEPHSLERHHPSGQAVQSAIHRAHAAAAEFVDELVARAEQPRDVAARDVVLRHSEADLSTDEGPR